MSQLNISSLLAAGTTKGGDGGQIRTAVVDGQSGSGSAAGEFARLIAGRLNPDGQASGAAQEGAALRAQVSVMDKSPLQQAVVAGQTSGKAGAGEKLLHVVGQIRQELARVHQHLGAQQSGAASAAAPDGGADGQSLSKLIGTLQKILDKAGIAGASDQQKSPGSTVDGAVGLHVSKQAGQVQGDLKQFDQLVKRLQRMLNQLQQKMAHAGVDTTAAAAMLQQVQAQLQQLMDKASKLQQQPALASRAGVNDLLKGLDSALATLQGKASDAGQSGAGHRQSPDILKELMAGVGGSKHGKTEAVDPKLAASAPNQKGGETGKTASGADLPAWLSAQLKRQASGHNAGAQNGKAQLRSDLMSVVQGGTQSSAQPAAHGSVAAQLPNAAQWLLSQSRGQRPVADPALSATTGSDVSGADATYSIPGLVSPTTLSGVLGGSGTTGSAPQVNPQLANNVGQQVSWMVSKNISSASINVSPAQLGPVKIHVQMQQDGSLQVQMLAHHHMARDALEQSLPRLREWLQESGMGNAQVSVGADASGGGSAQFANGSAGDQSGDANGDSSGSANGMGMTSAANGNESQARGVATVMQGPVTLLDLFA